MENGPVLVTDLLDHCAGKFPSHGIGYIYPDPHGPFLSFPQLRSKALSVLTLLRQTGLMGGSPVLVALAKAEEIIPVLWACFYGRMIPALVQPPVTFSEHNPAVEKLLKVWDILGGPCVVIAGRHMDEVIAAGIPAEKIIPAGALNNPAPEAIPETGSPEDTAMIQFSSGSTGDPKGIMLSHRNIIINAGDIIRGIKLGPSDISVNWMPLYHDMGLIGFHFTPVYAGVTQYFINPSDFVKHPSLWLDNLSRKRCTITACPNFGQLLVNRYLARRSDHHWDLSALRVIFNGAEPISVGVMQSFLKGLEPYGLDPVAMFPAYGLAEATLAVTFPSLKEEAVITPFNRMELLRNGLAIPMEVAGQDAIELVGLGTSLQNCQVRITDDQDKEIGEGKVGHIWVTGRNLTRGYFGEGTATLPGTGEEWFWTGDLGFNYCGNLYVTGRAKDIIFINGTNFFAHDLEHVVQQLDGVGYGKIVMSAWFDEAEGRDKLLVFLAASPSDENLQLCRMVKNHLNSTLGVTAETFILVRSADIPRTSSGKLQRYKLTERYLRGDFTSIFTV